MSMNRREFMQMLAVAAASGFALNSRSALSAGNAGNFYDLPPFGNVSLLHITDCHAQLLPIYFREPSINLGVGDMKGKPLKAETLKKIEEVLKRLTAKNVKSFVKQDDSLIGGVVVKIGDLVLDGSVKAQIEGLKETMRRGEYS